jgi:DNA-binding LytR/AlgR family response regulator
MSKPSAIIADDELNLATHLQSMLATLWPELEITGIAHNGMEALSLIREDEPDIAFLDIKMPVMDGLRVAMHCQSLCHVVFVTAYNEFAIEAFEHNAMDYLVKPVSEERLTKTIQRLKDQITQQDNPPTDLQQLIHKLSSELKLSNPTTGLQWIKAGKGDRTVLVPVDEVLYFKAGDKYTSVVTVDGELLIRKPIKELAVELDNDQFWQINRGIVVNVQAIDSTQRELNGRCRIALKNSDEVLLTSRKYAHLFKQM